MATKDWTFTTPGNYVVSDSNKIEVVDNVAKLKATSNKIFYNSLDDTDFTCETPSGLEFSSNTGSRDTTEKKFGSSSWKSSGSSHRLTYDYSNGGDGFWNGGASGKGTLSFWFKAASASTVSNVRQLFNLKSGATNNNQIQIFIGSNQDFFRARVFDKNGSVILTIDSIVTLDTNWHHLELGWDTDSGNSKFFIDGGEQGNSTATGDRSHITNGLDKLHLGWSSPQSFQANYDDIFILDAVSHTSNFTPPTIAGPNLYPTDKPYIQPISALDPIEVMAWSGFTETLGGGNEGSVGYILSDDNGSTWKYWGGTSWDTTVGDGTNYNSPFDVDTNLNLFDNSPDTFLWRAFLISNSTQQVELDNLELEYSETAQIWTFTTPGNYVVSDSNKIEVADNVAKLKSIYTTLFYNDFEDTTDWTCNTPSGLEACDTTGVNNSGNAKFGANAINIDLNGKLYFRNTSGNSFFSGANSNVGTLSLWVRPNYSGTPSDNYVLCSLQYSSVCTTLATNNQIVIYHDTSGNLRAIIRDKDGINIFNIASSWSAVANQQYHVELDWDVGSGSSNLFLDGNSVVSSSATGDRTETTYPTNQLSFGKLDSLERFDGNIDDIFLLDSVFHTSNFTVPSQAGAASYSIDKPYVQPTSALDPDTVTEWLSFSDVIQIGDSANIGYILSDDNGSTWKYVTGGSWTVTAGDGTNYNTASEIDASLSSFDASPDTFMWRTFLISDGVGQVKLDQIRLTYAVTVVSLDSTYISASASLVNVMLGYVRSDFTLQGQVDEFIRGVLDQINMDGSYLSGWNLPITIQSNLSEFIRGVFTLQDLDNKYVRGVIDVIAGDIGYIRGVIEANLEDMTYVTVSISQQVLYGEYLNVPLSQVVMDRIYVRSTSDLTPVGSDYLRCSITQVKYVPPNRDSLIVQRLESNIVEVT